MTAMAYGMKVLAAQVKASSEKKIAKPDFSKKAEKNNTENFPKNLKVV
ncbi:MAG: hypothetical protein K6A23_10365 [Butyrivibrio sp.]|nr:hypothetical protein [Butyrivibrio sp.]